jgi:regulatory protein
MEHRITALKLQKNRQRINVYLDGEFAFGVSHIVAAWLQVGQTISDEKIAQMQAQDRGEKAYQKALNLLNRRPRSEAEIAQKLKEKSVSEDESSETLARLRRSGLVDDARFAQEWVENRSDFRPRSRKALAFELRQKGVDQQIIEQSLEQLDEEQMAYDVAVKQARKLKDLDWPAFRQKMTAFLIRRGFDYEVSASTIQRVWSEYQEPEIHE